MKKQVMIVDDNQFALDLMARELRDIGLEAVCAHDGSEALGRLQWDDYALLITDLDLPGMTGNQVIEQVRRLYPAVPIIALATEAGVEEDLARQAGATVLWKPFSMVDFRAMVIDALQKGWAGRDPPQSTRPVAKKQSAARASVKSRHQA